MPDIFDSEAFCPLAWNGIYIQPDGTVDSCCVSQNRLGNINTQSIDSILSGQKSRDVRNQMISGVIVPGCNHCYPEKKTKPSHRESLVNFYQHRDRSLYESPDNFQLRYVDIRLRNTCNFGCVYCGPDLSSTIAQEQKQFPILNDNGIHQTIEYFKKNAKTIDRIYLAGGEPLLIKENEILLEEILKVNPGCKILVNTNLSQIKNNRIFDLLIKLPDVEWLISGEDMDKRYEYIRYKGSWQTFSNNLLYLLELGLREKIFFNMVYLSLNSKSIFRFIKWLEQNEFNTENINISWVNGYPLWDPRYLSKNFQFEIFETMKNISAGEKLRNSIDNIQVKFQAEFKKEYTASSVKSHLYHYDNLRNLDSELIFTDIHLDLENQLNT